MHRGHIYNAFREFCGGLSTAWSISRPLTRESNRRHVQRMLRIFLLRTTVWCHRDLRCHRSGDPHHLISEVR